MTAFEILAAGLSVLPIDPRTKRPPVKGCETYPEQTELHGYGWKPYQTHLPSEAIVRQFLRNYPGCWLGFACGVASGHLEALDFDIPGKKAFAPGQRGEAPSWEPWCAALRADGLGGLLDRLTIVSTPSGGRQAYYRCSGTIGNSKLANRPATDEELVANPKERVKGLIETRGMGGLVVCPPTPGYDFVQGDFGTIPTITDEERGALWAHAAAFDRMPPEPPRSTPTTGDRGPRPEDELSPGDDFDARASWDEVLEPHGYRKVGRLHGGMQLWAHPGKGKGDWSARTGVGRAGDRFYSWSPNGGVPHEKLLKKYALYAMLDHGGDFSAAAKALVARGYGSRASRPRSSPNPPPPSERSAPQGCDDAACSVGEHDEPEGLEVDGSPLGLPTIQHNGRQLPKVTEEAIAALLASNDPAHLFARAGKVVRIGDDKDDRHRIETLNSTAMRNEIGNAAFWVRQNDKGKFFSCYPPKDVAENILVEQSLSRRFPRLEGLSAVPVLSPSGGFNRHHGYDPESKWFVTDKGPFDPCGRSGAEAARFLLDELFHDFPFVDDASRATALALGLLPYVRPAILGPTPMHYVQAPQSRTGKSLLIEVALSPSLGKSDVASMAFPEKEEELNKLLATELSEGNQLIFFDNVKRRVTSSSLEQLLTTNVHKFRVLGMTASLAVPVKAIFALTVNNGKLSIDMAGRCVLIEIDAKMETPETREGFRHANIREFVAENRAEIRSAFMAMVEEWDRAGRPKGRRKKASYIEWSQTIGGILDVCGVPGFLENDMNLKGSAADEEEPWRAFYEVWWELHQGNVVTSKILFDLAEKHEMLGDVFAKAKSEKGRPTTFGMALSSREGKVLDGRRPMMLRRPDGKPSLRDGGQKQYQLLPIDGSGARPTQPQSQLAMDDSAIDVSEIDPFEEP